MQDSKLLVAGTISGANNAITGQSVAAAVGTLLSAYSVDMLKARDIGEGQQLYLKAVVLTDITTATTATIDFQAITADDAALTANVTVLAARGPQTTSSAAPIKAGTEFYIPVPPNFASLGRQFLGCQFVIAGATTTGGTVAAEFTTEVHDPKKFYPSGFAIV